MNPSMSDGGCIDESRGTAFRRSPCLSAEVAFSGDRWRVVVVLPFSHSVPKRYRLFGSDCRFSRHYLAFVRACNSRGVRGAYVLSSASSGIRRDSNLYCGILLRYRRSSVLSSRRHRICFGVRWLASFGDGYRHRVRLVRMPSCPLQASRHSFALRRGARYRAAPFCGGEHS